MDKLEDVRKETSEEATVGRVRRVFEELNFIVEHAKVKLGKGRGAIYRDK